jgi:MFS family permease
MENELSPSVPGELVATAGGIAVAEAEAPWWKGITRYQWIVLLMTSLGLMFDLMAANLLGVAMAPALRELLGAKASTQSVGWYGGLITTIFLVGWSLGGMLFGIYADYYGRKSALMVTILMYSLFTAISMFAHSWWDFAIYRFITALGTGGEWGAGTALLAETWPERSRVKSAVILQAASMFGGLVASLLNLLVGGYSWRYIFLLGGFPGFLLLGLRWWVKESDRWLAARDASQGETSAVATEARSGTAATKKHASPLGAFTLKQIFSKQMRRDTLVGTSLATIVTFGYWAVGWFVPTMVSEMLTQGTHKIAPAAVIHYVSNSRILIAVGSLLAYVVFLFLDTQWRRKRVLLFFFLGSFLSTMAVLYLPTSLATLLMLLPVMGFFVLGIWVVFPVYLPELYPTRLRATGSGFCFTFGRALSAVGPTLTGVLVSHTGSFITAMTIPTFVYLLGPVVLLFARETRGQTLQ